MKASATNDRFVQIMSNVHQLYLKNDIRNLWVRPYTGVSSGTRQDLELGRTTFRMRQIE